MNGSRIAFDGLFMPRRLVADGVEVSMSDSRVESDISTLALGFVAKDWSAAALELGVTPPVLRRPRVMAAECSG